MFNMQIYFTIMKDNNNNNNVDIIMRAKLKVFSNIHKCKVVIMLC